MKHKIAICYSGGVDSHVMRALAKSDYPDSEVVLCFYDIGQDGNIQERKQAEAAGAVIRKVDWLNEILRPLPATDTNGISRGAVMIPGRNAVLALLAACQELPDEVWLGATYGEANSPSIHHDKDFRMYDLMNPLFDWVLWQAEMTNKTPKLVFPLADRKWTTPQAVRYVLDNGSLTLEELENAHSCFYNASPQCGRCISCATQWGLFYQLGIEEHWNGAQHPMDDPELRKLLLAIYEERNNPDADVMDKTCITPAVEQYLSGQASAS